MYFESSTDLVIDRNGEIWEHLGNGLWQNKQGSLSLQWESLVDLDIHFLALVSGGLESISPQENRREKYYDKYAQACTTIDNLRKELERLKERRLLSAVFAQPERTARPFQILSSECVNVIAHGVEFPNGQVYIVPEETHNNTCHKFGLSGLYSNFTIVDAIASASDCTVVWVSERIEDFLEPE